MNMRPPHRSVMAHGRRAFTLLELVIVLGIILLLMGLVLGVGSIVLRQSEDRQIRSTMAIVDAALVEFEQQAGREGAARSLELRRRQRRRREETCSSSRSGLRLGLRRGSGFEPEQLCHGSGRVRVRLRVRVRAGAAAP